MTDSGEAHMTVAEGAVELMNIVKQFSADGPIILENVSLSVKPGEFVSLVGASGCGKSTLLNIISGLEKTTTGHVELAGPPTLMFQEPALMPWLTAGKNIELALELSGMPRRDRKARAQELLELVHLERSYKQRPHELSGGMRQRVAIARALVSDPKVLLMDEPFGALDEITRDRLNEELLRVWRELGMTVLFVTHSIYEAAFLGQRVLMLAANPGRVKEIVPVDLPADRELSIRETPAFVQLASHLRKVLETC